MTATSPSQLSRPQSGVVKYLHQKLVSLEPGEPLPGMRQIMRDCMVGQETVTRALATLRDEGLIETHPRKGHFKTAKAMSAEDVFGTLEVLFCHPMSYMQRIRGNFHDDLIVEITRQCARRWQTVQQIHVPEPRDLAVYEHIADRRRCRACLLVSPDRADLVQKVFAPRHVLAVNLLPRTAQLPVNSVGIVNDKVIALQLEHLWSLGHRRIAYLHGVDEAAYNRDLILRREQYYRMMAERGLPVEPAWVRYGGGDPQAQAANVEQLLHSPRRPTAFICSDWAAPAVYYTLALHGLRPGQEISVIGTDDLPISQLLYPTLTTVRVSRSQAVALGLQMLDQLVENTTIDQPLLLEPELVIRGSTGPAMD